MYHGYTEFGGEEQRREECLAKQKAESKKSSKVIINQDAPIQIKPLRQNDFVSTIKDLLMITTIFVGAYLVFLIMRLASLNLYHLIFDR